MATATAPSNRRPPAIVPGPEYRSHEEGEYVVYEDVPVWCEHDSKQVGVRFGKSELGNVVARCNERITETGDYSPLVIRHTEESGDSDPPVVGLAGPFKMGTIGKKNPKAAILARMRFFKADIDKVKRYPRVSVEYWFKKSDPTSGYFDPISLLGAETPELDLGLRYAKHRQEGEQCIRYHRTVDFAGAESRANYAAAANPGGANTFMPGLGDGDQKNRRPEDRGAMNSVDYDRDGACQTGLPLSAAAVAQIVEALRPVVREQVMEAMPAPPPPPPPNAAESFSANADAADETGAGDESAGAEFPPPGSAPAGDDQDADDLTGDAADKSSSEPGDRDGGRDAAAGTSQDKSLKPKKSEAEDMADSSDKNKGKAKYSAELSGELTKIVSETLTGLKAGEVVARYEKLAKQSVELIDSLGAKLDVAVTERDDYRAKYEKATREATDKGVELTELKARVDSIEADRRRNARYAKLQDMVHRDGYQIDIEDELKDFAAADDATFERHVERIRSKYQRVPLHGPPIAPNRFEGRRSEHEPSDDERARFAKQAAEEVYQARQRGERGLTYESALKAVYQKAGKALPVAV